PPASSAAGRRRWGRGSSRSMRPAPTGSTGSFPGRAGRDGEARSAAKEMLERDVGAHGPVLLVVPGPGEGEVEELAALLVAPFQEVVAHGVGGLEGVLRPAAVEIELDRPLRLGRHPLHEVVAEAEGRGETA